MIINSVFNKNQTHYNYNVFLEKYLYQLAQNNNNKTFWNKSIIMFRFGKTKLAKEEFYGVKNN